MEVNEFNIGLVVTVLEDTNPVVIYNRSNLNESETIELSVKISTTMGDMTEREILGPFPVQNREDLQTLAFLHTIFTKDTKDERLAEFRRPIAFYLIFNFTLKRQVILASGIVQSYLTLLVRTLDSEKELTQKRLDHICERITTLIAQSRVRVYGYIFRALFEFDLERLPPLIPVLVIADGRKKNLYVLHIPGREPRSSVRRNIGNLVNALNRSEFQDRLQIVQITDPVEVRDKLKYYHIYKQPHSYLQGFNGIDSFEVRRFADVIYFTGLQDSTSVAFLLPLVSYARKNTLIGELRVKLFDTKTQYREHLKEILEPFQLIIDIVPNPVIIMERAGFQRLVDPVVVKGCASEIQRFFKGNSDGILESLDEDVEKEEFFQHHLELLSRSLVNSKSDRDPRSPSPYVYYFPYPKGPPDASTKAILKTEKIFSPDDVPEDFGKSNAQVKREKSVFDKLKKGLREDSTKTK